MHCSSGVQIVSIVLFTSLLSSLLNIQGASGSIPFSRGHILRITLASFRSSLRHELGSCTANKILCSILNMRQEVGHSLNSALQSMAIRTFTQSLAIHNDIWGDSNGDASHMIILCSSKVLSQMKLICFGV